MPARLSKSQARAYRKRWELVDARELRELRTTPLEVKLQQFNTLMGWARQLGWTDVLREGEAEVRQRWMRLRKVWRG